ncbi:ankyrin repeat domain-containing protein 26-like [Megalops cyprinoides]|uniref:ankyrin repeat domain-containing protein 26-like n=1 Tax=Megalops cyprinoides TaxID=118141 RepID=UPI0018644B1E|nr:ankyrin repeat domain-containing protein 26-like [Megalops cyprinoides]
MSTSPREDGSSEEEKPTKGKNVITRSKKPLEVEDSTSSPASDMESDTNVAMRYDDICTWLEKTVEQYHVEERKKVEMVSDNLELEQELVSYNRQLEEDRNEAQCLLTFERKRKVRMQKELEKERRRNLKAKDRETELLEQNRSLQDEVMKLKLELEQERASRDLWVSKETLDLTVSQFSDQIGALKAELETKAQHLSELEREKEDLCSQIEAEKTKSKMAAELKETVDMRLNDEVKRNTELQTEVLKLRTMLKTDKKKLREQDTQRQVEIEATLSKMKSDVDKVCQQLEEETLKSSRLEAANRDLEEQLSPLRTLSKRYKKVKKSRKQMEAEVKSLRQQMEFCKVDQVQVKKSSREVEQGAQKDMQKKMEEVNLFLRTQAASQESRERLRATNEARLRTHLEERIRFLESELDRAWSCKEDIITQRECLRLEMHWYKNLYKEELGLREDLEAMLERANERLEEASVRHQRSTQLLISRIISGNTDV